MIWQWIQLLPVLCHEDSVLHSGLVSLLVATSPFGSNQGICIARDAVAQPESLHQTPVPETLHCATAFGTVNDAVPHSMQQLDGWEKALVYFAANGYLTANLAAAELPTCRGESVPSQQCKKPQACIMMLAQMHKYLAPKTTCISTDDVP